MTPNNEFAVQCNQVLNSIVLFIDNEIEDSAQFNAVAFHLQECDGCRDVMELERQQLQMVQTMLTRSCCETAPQELIVRIHNQVNALAAELAQAETIGFMGQTEIITKYSRTEITIDGETQIEIETSHEIWRDF
jgi:mycothiol system anti-sigma-R factor